MNGQPTSQHFQVVVIGAGQAGLSVGYCLARHNLSFVILEERQRVGDSWRSRWDSLRLFTPARYDGLVGMPFPADPQYFPTKDEMADYLEKYARHFELPVRTGMRVERVRREGERYVVTAGGQQITADQVVIAMATYQQPRLPECAASLDPGITQIHSSEYRNPGQLRSGDVLIVGAGNSGAEIAVELARTRRVFLSGRHPGHVPFRINGAAARVLLPFIFRVIFHRVLTVDTPLGRRARPSVISKGGPLIRVKPSDLDAAEVQRTARVEGVRDGKPLLADGRTLDVANVVWCTGFTPGFSWLELAAPVCGADGEPVHDRGVVPGEPGVYFVGLHFLYSFSSTMIHGVGRDAKRIADAVASRVKTAAGSPSAATPLTT